MMTIEEKSVEVVAECWIETCGGITKDSMMKQMAGYEI